jgi:23S rRNA (uracil1939-C5)-methyltransferase
VHAVAEIERLAIDHVGHRGDGVAISVGQSIYVPYTLGGETIEAETIAGHPDRRRLIKL